MYSFAGAMKGIIYFLLVAGLLEMGRGVGEARTWTSTDGKAIEAEFVSATEKEVTIKRADGKSFTLPLTRLSDDDRAWIAENKDKAMAADTGEEAAPIEGPFADLVTGDWAMSEYEGLPFAFFGGKELDGGKKYPLLLTLHGKSDNNENGKQIGFARKFASGDNYSERPCFIVAPLCYQPFGATGGGWSKEPGDKAIELVEALIEALPIDENRIYVVGYSMGGFGTCHVMAKEPKLFTAGVPVAGYGYGGQADDLKREPIWLFQAEDDNTVGVEGARSFAEALKRSDVFKYTEYPDGGHGIIGRVIDDQAMHEWLFSQVDE
jgi:dienelactone hydrolase